MNTSNTQFPVQDVIPQIRSVLKQNNVCVLSAPPGAGKTTIVPPALLDEEWMQNGKIIMLEPRRLAARRSAEYMSALRGEACGQTIGYRIRNESRTSSDTRLEVVTEGILTRMLQNDPELPGVSLIIFDEFHERSIHADTGLAFAYDVLKNLRPDLRILIMSATLDGAAISRLLDDAPVVESHGRMYPVDIHYMKAASDVRAEQKVTDAVLRAVRNSTGDILVFLPGRAEISRTEIMLGERLNDADVIIHKLYGELPREMQDAALNPDRKGRRKIILSTSIAETSLTIDGVSIVVDSGLARVPAFDPRRGMQGLITTAVSKATARQRSGRAGRQSPGTCYRMMTESEYEMLPEFPAPEILSADITPLALELSLWGAPDASGLAFSDPPPSAHLRYAQNVLRRLGALGSNDRVTTHGRRLYDFPLHPRFASMIMHSEKIGKGAAACLIAAALDERELLMRVKSADLSDLWHALFSRRAGYDTIRERVFRQYDRLRSIAGIKDTAVEQDEEYLGIILAFAYPDRVAKIVSGNRYQLSQGTNAVLPENTPLAGAEFLTVADVDNSGALVRIFMAARLSKEQLLKQFAGQLAEESITQWQNGRITCRNILRFGEIILNERQREADDSDAVRVIIETIRNKGLSVLPWDKESLGLRSRNRWYREFINSDNWPDLSDETLLQTLDQWLAPFLPGIRNIEGINTLELKDILMSVFTYEQMQELDQMAPSHLRLPSGTRALIDYDETDKPVLAVKLQELFGQTDTPRIAAGAVPVLIHLLSPAMRPLSVTQDLRSFWMNTYPEIIKQMRMKYPRHVWPDDPLNAAPTNRTKPRNK